MVHEAHDQSSSSVTVRPVSALTIWLAYGSATIAALATARYLEGVPWADAYLLKGLLVDLVATVVVYLFSLCTGNSSIYDPYWCLAPLFLGFYWKAHAPGGFFFYEPRETLCIVLLWVWAARFFFGIPWEGWWHGLHMEDWRYELMRRKLPGPVAYWAFSFTSLHITPTLLVYFGLCPVGRVILQGPQAPPLNWCDTLAVSMAVLGILIEAVADEQLRRFRLQTVNGGDGSSSRSLHTGLWRWSRHPNYCGECLFWTGLLGMGLAAGVLPEEPQLVLGAIILWIFFRFASVPLMDERNETRRPDYKSIMATTSPLLLWPPRTKHQLD